MSCAADNQYLVLYAPVIYQGDIYLGDTLERGCTRRLQAALTIPEGSSLANTCGMENVCICHREREDADTKVRKGDT